MLRLRFRTTGAVRISVTAQFIDLSVVGKGAAWLSATSFDPDFAGRFSVDTDSFSYWYRHKIVCDTIGLARTEIVRRHPFPYAESRGAPEALAFNRIARRYLTRFIDDPIAIVDFQPDGLTARPRSEVLAEPKPWLAYYWEALTFPRWVPLSTRTKFALNCVRFGARTILGR